jgi:hypothetical protein
MRFPAHFGHWLQVPRRGRTMHQWQVAAGLIYGQVKKIYRLPPSCSPIWSGGERTITDVATARLAAHCAASPTSARGEASGTTLPSAYRSHGSGKNHPTVDHAGSALFPFAIGATPRTMSVKGVRRHHMALAEGSMIKPKAGTSARVAKMKPPSGASTEAPTSRKGVRGL